MNIKERLKKNPAIVALYETVFGRIHKLRINALRIVRVIQFRMTVKTHFRYGDKNKDKTFFVISEENGRYMGLYSAIFNMLPYIDYAVKKKWIPVIDLQRVYLPSLQDEDRMGKENSWEYYYEQPIKCLTLEEVYQSRHVIMKRDMALMLKIRHPDWNTMFPTSEKELKHWNQIIKSYIRLNNELDSRVESERKRIFKDNHKILGVGIRAGLRAGAMRGGELYNNHPKQPTCEELMDIVEEKMKSWKCDALFVSSDDREYLNKFISHFGDKCFYIDRKLIHFFKNGVPVMRKSEARVEIIDSTVKEITEEYVIEVYLLAQCYSLYSCSGGGAEFAYFLNGGEYEYCEVYNEGLYTDLENKDTKGDKVTGYELEN